MDNARLTEVVRAELRRMGSFPTLDARMADGIVTLSGCVGSERLRQRIEQQLLALPEVMDVHNYLKVAAASDGLADRLVAMLDREGVATQGVRVAVEDGVVTLTGEAASWFDRDAMSRMAWTLPRVREVRCGVSLPPGAVEPDRDAAGDLIP